MFHVPQRAPAADPPYARPSLLMLRGIAPRMACLLHSVSLSDESKVSPYERVKCRENLQGQAAGRGFKCTLDEGMRPDARDHRN